MLELWLGILAGQIVLLLVLRPMILWYFKFSRMTKALESIDESLKQLPAVQAYRAKMSQPRRRVA